MKLASAVNVCYIFSAGNPVGTHFETLIFIKETVMVDSSPQSLFHQSLEVLDKIGASPDDARDFRLQRKLLERRGV